jgi:beta-lactamase superfamily II metal-dependent hydrolase
MKLSIFPSGSGDCLLLSSDNDHHVLVDGGFGKHYKSHVRDNLQALVNGNLDVVCVSHIDSDHISGILEMLDNEVAWRVFKNHENDPPEEGANFPEPGFSRPPRIDAFWYNGFRDIVDDVTAVEDVLLFNTRALGFAAANLAAAMHMDFLATGVKQGLQLQNRISPGQLGMPLNPPRDGKPLLVQSAGERLDVGAMKITLLGPFKEDLERLRDEWNEFVTKNEETIREVQRQAEEDQRLLGLNDADAVRRMLANFVASQERGDVTPPNLASIVFLAEEGEQKFLMTGDARDNEIIKGLEFTGHLDDEGRMHADVLKIPHHGSINNVNREFCKAITADHYVICGGSGGHHENPDIAVLQFILDSRMGGAGHKSTHPKADDDFTLWFSSNTKDGGKSANEHMEKVFDFIQPKVAASGGRFRVRIMGEGQDRMVVPEPPGGQPD